VAVAAGVAEGEELVARGLLSDEAEAAPQENSNGAASVALASTSLVDGALAMDICEKEATPVIECSRTAHEGPWAEASDTEEGKRSPCASDDDGDGEVIDLCDESE